MSSFVTKVAGYRFQNGNLATAGEPVRFVREPQNAADPNAIAIHNNSGQRIGYLFREIAARYAVPLDRGFVRLVGRLAAPGEPNYDPALAEINPQVYLWIYADQAYLDASPGQTA